MTKLIVNYTATYFGCTTAIIRPTLNIVYVHRLCALFGIPYRLHKWYIELCVENYYVNLHLQNNYAKYLQNIYNIIMI
jgi:hypothetical protein